MVRAWHSGELVHRMPQAGKPVVIGRMLTTSHPTASSGGYTANRLLAVAQTAYALGKPVWVYYVSSTSSNPPGCNTGDCRFLTGPSMVN